MKDREVMVVYSPCHLTPEERILAKEKYDKAERAEAIPIGNQMLYASYVMSAGKQFSVKNKKRHLKFAEFATSLRIIEVELEEIWGVKNRTARGYATIIVCAKVWRIIGYGLVC